MQRSLPDCVGHDRQHIPGELDPQKQQFLLPLFPPFLPAALVSSPFASEDCITRLPPGLPPASDPLITYGARTQE